MQCKFCDFWPNFVERHQEMHVNSYRKLSRELSDYGSFIVSIEGGEPLVRPDIVEIVSAFASNHFPILFTNGWYVTEHLGRRLFAQGLHQVGVSIDFPDAVRHDEFRGVPGAFARAKRAIDIFKRYDPLQGGQVHIISVLMRENQHDLEALLQLSKTLGVGHQFTLVSNTGYRRANGASQPEKHIPADLAGLRERYPHLRSLRNYVYNMDRFLNQQSLPVCNAGQQSFNIDHIGRVSPCIEKIDHSYGNIADEPLADILERMHALQDVKDCQECWTLCRGMAQSFQNRGSLRDWRDLMSRRNTV